MEGGKVVPFLADGFEVGDETVDELALGWEEGDLGSDNRPSEERQQIIPAQNHARGIVFGYSFLPIVVCTLSNRFAGFHQAL